MSAAALLRELEAAGVRVTRTGEDLRVKGNPASITAFRERLAAHKPGVLMELLQREIVAAATVEPADFDRSAYDGLWTRYHALDPGAAP